MMDEKNNFIDILIPRKAQYCGIIRFMSRAWYPKKTVDKNKYCTPQDVKNIVASSTYLDFVIEAESLRTGIPKEKLQQQMREYLEEMGLDRKVYKLRWLVFFFLKLIFMMKVSIFVNEAAILDLKKTMGKNPILYLPTHRSYVDISLMTYLGYHYEIDIPSVAAGMDLYSMAVIGRTLNDTNAFYMRRTIVGEPLYAATLRQYVSTLVSSYGSPVEFFLEGTRSRGNKSLPPKYGMLSMSLLPLFSHEVSDITAVPINFSYDRLVEDMLFAHEHLGVPKPKETTRSFLKSISSLNDNYGNFYINIGKPFSLKEYIKKEFSSTKDALLPNETLNSNQEISSEQFKQVQMIADYVIVQQQKATVTCVSNLLALVLMGSLIENKPLSIEEVIEEVRWMEGVARRLGATVLLDDVKTEVERMLLVHSYMVILDKDRRLRLVAGMLMNVTEDMKRRMKGHTLKAETMVNAVPIVQLQLYVNPTHYYLVPPALIYTVVCRGATTKEQLATDWHRIRKLLKHEFFYVEKVENDTFRNALQYCLQNEVIVETDTSYSPGAHGRLQYLFKWTTWPALTTLLKCAEVMTELQRCEHKKALKCIQERVEMSECHPYCLSLDAAANCLQGLVLSGALTRYKGKEVVYELVPEVMKECRRLVESLLPSFCVNFGQNNTVIFDQRVLAKL